MFQFQDANGDEHQWCANGDEHQWCATARGAPDEPQRILFEAEPEVFRVDPNDRKKRVKVKLPLRQRLHEVISKFGSLEVMKKQFTGEDRLHVCMCAGRLEKNTLP